MKKISHVLSIAFLTLVLASCSSGDSPKIVTEKFLNAIADKKFDEAKKLATPESAQMMDMIAGIASMEQDQAKVSFEVLSEQIEGDKATVLFKSTEKDEEQSMILRKVDGQWKVSMSKQDLNMNKGEGAGGSDTLEGEGGDLELPEENSADSLGKS